MSSPTSPASEPDAPAGGSAAAAHRRALAAALAAGALGAATVLVASGRVWSEGTAVLPQGEIPVRVTGGEVTGLPSALALVGLAALVAVFAVRRTGRTLVAALLTLCGAGVAVAALLGTGDDGALEAKASEVSGLARGTVEGVSHGMWPHAAALGGLLLLTAGLLALRHGRHWPAMSGRHERAGASVGPGARRPAPDPDRPEELWKALDRGEDPTTGGAGNRP
ncbi:TIGR02234 family membrane protein [Streptomyces sp. TRM43335]|uniref:TIGR02234 family membrane protein n=1 Tax=Streptomyces taklimakanensis TaxID=2569853 RepID=A0A6G2B955_9ACTN|nr:TIGR02234 family membrane protein [Streptomyces taklimakanensis]